MTDLYGVLGHPIGHLRSPALFNQSLAERGWGGIMVPLDVRPEGLPQALAALRAIANLRGLLVTMPHKEAVCEHLDGLTAAAAATGAVNIIRRHDGKLIGGQLDGAGFVAAMRRNGADPKGKRVHVAGAGGVSAGICHALAEAGALSIAIQNRTRDRAAKLAGRLQPLFTGCTFMPVDGAPGRDIDIVVNATSLGLRSTDPVPVDLAGTRAGIHVGDVVNIDEDTPLLRIARERGCTVQRGRDMVIFQIDLMHEFFAGRPACL